jgi:hypothetical protein
VISEEFLKAQKAVNDLKLRASMGEWGMIGIMAAYLGL